MLRALFLAIGLLGSSGVGGAAAEPSTPGLSVGAFGGLGADVEGGGRLWVGGALLEAGRPEGVGIRLGASMARPPGRTLLRLETLMMVNARMGAWVYFAGGLGVERQTFADGTPSVMSFPLVAAAGLRSRLVLMGVPWRFFVEGRLWTPASPSLETRPMGVELLAGVLLSF